MLSKGSLMPGGMVRGSSTRDPVAGIEWKAKGSVNEKPDLLQVGESESVVGGAGG